MTSSGLDIFDLAERRLAWVDQRQTVLSQNIANANTPNYTPQDVQPFQRVLQGVSAPLARTDPRHIAPPVELASFSQDRPAERAPDKNAVSLESQLMKVAETDSTQALATSVYHAYLGLFRTAAGKGSS